MKEKKKIIVAISLIVALLVITLGITYAAFVYRENTNNQQLVLGEIYMYYNEINQLNIENALPGADYSNYFEFTINGKNTYNQQNIYYEVVLTRGDTPEDKIETNRLSDSSLLFKLVEVNGEEETVLLEDKTYDDLTSQQLYMAIIEKGTITEVNRRYRLYAKISDNITICGGEVTEGCDYFTSGDTLNWSDAFASIKVNVKGDLKPRVMVGEDGKFEYTLLSNEKIQISKYLGDETNVVIPASYDGYEVYSVGNLDAGTTAATRYNIFGPSNSTTNTTVQSITIEEGIEVIEMGAFSKCTGLKEFNLPDSLKVIGHTAFNGCTGLTGDLVIPEGVEVIDIGAFQNCNGFDGTLTLPSTLKTIGQNAFFKCTKLTGDLIIPEGVTTLQKNAFNTCSGFNGTLTIPSTLSVIGEYAFTESKGFTNLVIKEGVTKIEESAFQSLTGITGTLTLPNTLEELGPYAFAYNNFSGSLTIPNSVTIIGEGAFNSNESFDGILTLPNNLISIGDFAFNHCSGFTNTTLDIPNTVQTIGLNETDATHVFYDFATKSIESYTINNSLTASGDNFKVIDGILYNNSGTRLVAYPANKIGNIFTMPEGITIIDELAFSRVGSTYSSVGENGIKKLILPNSYVLTTTLPTNYLNVGNNLAVGIYNQTSINEIAVKDDNPNYKTEDGILYSKDGTTLWYVPIQKTGTIQIPEGVTTIKGGAFYATNRTQTITIPASVTEIDAQAITELQNLSSSKVTFDPDCVYEFTSAKKISKKS